MSGRRMFSDKSVASPLHPGQDVPRKALLAQCTRRRVDVWYEGV
jgi:hypothetical protein